MDYSVSATIDAIVSGCIDEQSMMPLLKNEREYIEMCTDEVSRRELIDELIDALNKPDPKHGVLALAC